MKTISTDVIITSLRSKVDRSISMSITTPELTAEEVAYFFQLQGSSLEMLLSPKDEEAPTVKIDKDLNSKSQSSRIRAILYILWKQDNEDMDYETYYKAKTEKIIEHLKSKIIDP